MDFDLFSNNYLSFKWSIDIFFSLTDLPQRPSFIFQESNGISKKVLYDRISFLIEKGLLEKKVITLFPSHVEYKFTKDGEEIVPFLRELKGLEIDTEVLSYVFKYKWIKPILISLSGKSLRAMELKKSIEGISNKVLSERLRKLEKLQLIDRKLTADVPVRVDYKTTDSGKRLAEFLTKFIKNTINKRLT